MKIHIPFKFVEGPWGGGNQFLKGLMAHFESAGAYEISPAKADVILFNSHHSLGEVIALKRKWPHKIFIHRVDGPVFLVRGGARQVDNLIFLSNELIANGTIFQSDWSRRQCYAHGLKKALFETVIMNAPDPGIFNAKSKVRTFAAAEKIRLIATSWSPNSRKGFDVYQYLDQKLDFSRYEMTFVGNSPVEFQNIRHISPLTSVQLSGELKKHDIFITASVDDPCSNSLVEALHCGLPAVVRDSGGHPEIAKNSGKVFHGLEDVCEAIDSVAHDYESFWKNISVPPLSKVGAEYYEFMNMVYRKLNQGHNHGRRLSMFSHLKLLLYARLLR